MNRNKHVLGWMTALAAGVALLAACSDDEGNKSSGGGGTSSSSAGSGGGKAGSSSSASGSSSGGKSNSGGATNNAGNNNAGTNNNGGFNFGGDGGFDPGDFMCDPVPEQGSACEEDAEPCLNDNLVCGCQNGEWMCIDLGGGEGGGPGGGFQPPECPEEQPMTGDECSGLGFCPYGGQNMGCGCNGQTWTCTN